MTKKVGEIKQKKVEEDIFRKYYWDFIKILKTMILDLSSSTRWLVLLRIKMMPC